MQLALPLGFTGGGKYFGFFTGDGGNYGER